VFCLQAQADGDTMTVLDDARRTEVRQPYGSPAKQALSELVFGRDVRVVVVCRGALHPCVSPSHSS
jgi:endonuclease YncB( thermonuclease family)